MEFLSIKCPSDHLSNGQFYPQDSLSVILRTNLFPPNPFLFRAKNLREGWCRQIDSVAFIQSQTPPQGSNATSQWRSVDAGQGKISDLFLHKNGFNSNKFLSKLVEAVDCGDFFSLFSLAIDGIHNSFRLFSSQFSGHQKADRIGVRD